MNKILRWIAIFLWGVSAAGAAPVGNPACPKILCKGLLIPSQVWANVRLGYEGDFITDARFKQKGEGSRRVDDYDMSTNAATFTLNLLARLDLYGVFGSSHFSSNWRFTNALNEVRNVEMETKSRFLWGMGVRSIPFSWCGMDLGLGARFSACHNHPEWLMIDGAKQSVSGVRADWKEWQVNLGASYHIKILTPYIGVKYSKSLARIGRLEAPIAANGSGNNQFVNRFPVGAYVGCTLSNGKYLMVNIEGRLIDEEALTISGDLRF